MHRRSSFQLVLVLAAASGLVCEFKAGGRYQEVVGLKAESNSRNGSLRLPNKPFEFNIGDFSIIDASKLWAVGQKRSADGSRLQSIALHSSDGGRSWKTRFADGQNYFFDIHFISKRIGWISGGDGLVLKSTDGGGNWAKQDTQTASPLVDVEFIDQDLGWALSIDGSVLRTTDGGSRWATRQIKVSRFVNHIGFSDRNHGWVVGEGSQAYQTTDGGVTWTSRGRELIGPLDKQSLHDADFRAVKFINAKVGFIAAEIMPKRIDGEKDEDEEEKVGLFNKGVVLKTQDSGRTWSVFLEREFLGLVRGEFPSEEEAWIIHGNDGEVIHTVNGGRSWSRVSSLPTGVKWIRFADGKNGWAQVGHGWFTDSILYTNDGGKTWAEAKLPDN